MQRWDTPAEIVDKTIYQNVTRTDCGNILKYKMYSGIKHDMPIINIDRDHFVKKETGELLTKNHKETKGENLSSVKRSFSRLHDLIQANYTDNRNVLFITLTYADLMLCSRQTSKDFQHFIRSVRTSLHVPDLRYISVVEKQSSGRWHIHALLFFDAVAPYLDDFVLSHAWPYGFYSVKRDFDDVRNLAAYICADLSWSDSGDKHKVDKVSRLLNYESGLHLYRCSKNCKRPVETAISFDDYKQETSKMNLPIYDKCVSIRFSEMSPTTMHLRYQTHLRVTDET